MSLQELAGLFADDSEKPYAKYDLEPEPRQYATGGEPIGFGNATLIGKHYEHLIIRPSGLGKSRFVENMLESLRAEHSKSIEPKTVMIFDDCHDDSIMTVFDSLSPQADRELRRMGGKPVRSTSEKNEYKAKTRGRKHPGKGW